MGFSWMVFADRQNFDRSHYEFSYVHREFLGEVRCLVFDVRPKKGAGQGLFQGRIWVEDQDYNIVRLNGTYVPRPKNAFYFHMDSWRLNLVPGYWIPSYIYSEEGDFSYGSKDKMAFKAQSRIWGYNLAKNNRDDEMTAMTVDSVKDERCGTRRLPAGSTAAMGANKQKITWLIGCSRRFACASRRRDLTHQYGDH
jgi:hypothetical protein